MWSLTISPLNKTWKLWNWKIPTHESGLWVRGGAGSKCTGIPLFILNSSCILEIGQALQIKPERSCWISPPPIPKIPLLMWGEIIFLCECVLNLRKLLRFVEIKRQDSQRDYIHDFQSVSDPGIKAQSYFCCSFYKCFQGIKALDSSWILSLQMANIHYLIEGLSNVMETQLAIYALTIEICASIIQEEICVCHVWHLWKLNLRLHSKFWHVVLLLLL